jgi:HSP20 family protein
MRIVRYDPFEGLTSLHSQLDDMFNSVLAPGNSQQMNAALPAMDVYNEDDKQLVAEVHAPGFDKDDIDINVHEGVLEIRGQHQERQEDKGKKKRNYMLRESQASFYRRIALPKHANGDKVNAQFEDGLLKVVVPFKELPKPKKIAIQAGKKK